MRDLVPRAANVHRSGWKMTSPANLGWKTFFVRLYDLLFEADVLSRAAQIGFYFSFALFPLLYFLVSLFGLVLESSDSLRGELYRYLQQIMPMTVFDLVKKTVDEIVASSTSGKLTLGIVVTLWSASAGVDAVRTALNAVYQVRETRSIWRTKAQSLVLTLVVAILVAGLLTTVFYGWQLVGILLWNIGFTSASPWLLVVVQWLAILLVMLLVCEIIYNLLPDLKPARWIWITPGSIVAIVLWILLTTGFRVYLGYFNTYNKAYGSLAAVMIMMLWLYLTAVALLVGGAINSVVHRMHIDASAEIR
jgi:membrane protein